MAVKWSENQEAVFEFVVNGRGNAIVVAVAGAGKTSTMVEAVSRYVSGRRGAKVFLGAFNKKMADELRGRVSHLSGVFAGTFHSAGFRALTFACGKQHGLKLDGNKLRDIAVAMSADRPDLVPCSATAVKIASMAKQRGLGAVASMDDIGEWYRMAEHFSLDEDLPESETLDKACRFARVLLKKSNEDLSVIDFDDMVYLPLLLRLKMLKHDIVVIDEAQDTNPTRRALARAMLAPGGRLIAVGDPHQAIFGFTGADNDSLDQIASDFSCERLELTVTYRCPKSVVRVARQYVSHITAADSAPDGIVREADYSDLMTARAGDFVLCRFNKYLVEACFALIRAGVPAKMEGRAIGEGLAKLAGKWKVKGLDALRGRLETYRDREIQKAMEKDNPGRADRVADQVDTMYVLIQRAELIGIATISGLQEMIVDMFSADADDTGLVVCCSGHRSKGLERPRVFVIGLGMSSPFATKPHELDQEVNLCYVMVTRAQEELVLVPAPVDRKEPA